MKTIRESCFETNSSSTHSVTITNVDPESNLVEDGTLYPVRLKDSSTLLFYGTYNDSYSLRARTKEEKLALLFHHVKNSGNMEEIAVQLTKEILNLDVNLEFACQFEGYDDDGDSYVDKFNCAFDSQEQKIAAMREHFYKVIMNDAVMIEEKEEEY